jgi:hypothetical protein
MSAKITLRTLKIERVNIMSRAKETKVKKTEFKDKIKSSYYLDQETEARIVEIYLKRLKEGQRPRKSNIVDQAVLLLYEKEFKK